jgi:hypothetical protein
LNTISGLDQYPLSGGYVYNIFDKLINPEASTYFRTGSVTHFPTYSAISTGEYSVNISLPLSIEVPSSINADWELQVYKSGSTGETLIANDLYNFNTSPPISYYWIGKYVTNSTINCYDTNPKQNVWLDATDYIIYVNNGGFLAIGMTLFSSPNGAAWSGNTKIYDFAGATRYDISAGQISSIIFPIC